MSLSDTLQSLIASGVQIAAYSKKTADSNLSASETLKNQLYANAGKIQSLINNILEKGGIITEDEVNELDEQIRLSKLKVLEAEAKSSTTKYAIYVLLGLAAVGTIWYFTYKKI